MSAETEFFGNKKFFWIIVILLLLFLFFPGTGIWQQETIEEA